MRKADAIKKYGGVHYTIEKGGGYNDCVIVERLGQVPDGFRSTPLAHCTYEDAQTALRHEYLKDAVNKAHDDLLERVSRDSLLEYKNKGYDPEEFSLYESAGCLRDHVIYSDIEGYDNIKLWNVDAEVFLAEYSEHIHDRGMRCYIEESFKRRSSIASKMLPDNINVTANPLNEENGAYAVFIEDDGNISVGKLSLSFNGVVSYSTVEFSSGNVSVLDSSANIPVYRAYMSNREVGLLQYVDPEHNSDISDVTGILNLYDGYINGEGEGYNNVEVYLDKKDVVDCLSKLDASNPEKYNTFPAYSQLENL